MTSKSGTPSLQERIESFVKWMVAVISLWIVVVIAWPIPSRPPHPPIPQDVRNARNLASVYSPALAAGGELQEVDSMQAAIAVLRRGVYGRDHFADTKFCVPNISDDAVREVMPHLRWKEGRQGGRGELVYERDCCEVVVELEQMAIFTDGVGGV